MFKWEHVLIASLFLPLCRLMYSRKQIFFFKRVGIYLEELLVKLLATHR